MDDPTIPAGGDARFAPPDPSTAAGRSDPAVSDPDAPVLIGVSFSDVLKAQEYLLAMRRLRRDGAIDLKDAVVVTKDADGGVRVTETLDPTPGKAALSGAVWAGLLGLLVGGPVGWLTGLGVGAGTGAVAAKVIDLGIPDEWVDWFKEAVAPGTSTVVVLGENVHVGALAAEARRFGDADLLYTTMAPDADRRLGEAFDAR